MLAVSSGERLTQLPDVPTFAEAGFAELQSAEWFGLFAPAGTSPATIARLNRAAIDAFTRPEVRKAMGDLAFSVTTSAPEAFGALMKRDLDRWRPVVKSTGFRIDE